MEEQDNVDRLKPIHPEDKTVIFGILNVTPDSFSDGGRFQEVHRALEHAKHLVSEGADVIDVGAESTRPGFTPLTVEEEWSRLKPILQALTDEIPVPISVDTYKAEIAYRALECGVHIINDIWGGMRDKDILRVVADAKCHYIWMHNRDMPVHHGAVQILIDETQFGIDQALSCGIQPDKLWIDPGVGFGKTYEQNLLVLQQLSEYCKLNIPVLLGTSRKSVIGNTLAVPPTERLAGSIATVALGVQAGVKAVRVHDVLATRQTCRMVEAIIHAE